MHNRRGLCACWIENPYYQYFCGELSFCHRLPFDRSSMTRWRHRLGEEQLVALIQESLSVAQQDWRHRPKGLERVVVDTRVQPKAIAHPTDARLMHRAITKLVGLATRNRVPLRQSYLRLAKRAAIMVGRYTHASPEAYDMSYPSSFRLSTTSAAAYQAALFCASQVSGRRRRPMKSLPLSAAQTGRTVFPFPLGSKTFSKIGSSD
jgi:hypothetical protein